MNIDTKEIQRYAGFYQVSEREVLSDISSYRTSYFLDMLLHPNNFENVKSVFSDSR